MIKKENFEWERMGRIFFKKTVEFLKFQGLNLMKKTIKYQWAEEDNEILRALVRYLIIKYR